MNCVPDFVENGMLRGWMVAGVLILLAAAAAQDLRTQSVTNGIWIPAILLAVVTGCIVPVQRPLWEPLLYLFLQQIFFHRFYGRADCHAFSCCGFSLWGLEQGMAVYLWHMLVALLLLGVCQLLKGNVNSRGNLRTPVPFIPYIFLGFCGILAWIWL